MSPEMVWKLQKWCGSSLSGMDLVFKGLVALETDDVARNGIEFLKGL